MWQALTGFALQVLAAHLLGAAGLGRLALSLGAIIIGTAVVSGFVGDSMTVLDRRDRATRAGLQAWALVAMSTCAVVVAGVLLLTGVLDTPEAVLLALAALAFQAGELMRRLVMVNQRFWRLLPMDTATLVLSVGVVAAASATGRLSLSAFLVAIALGQSAGCLVALALIPDQDRVLVRLRGAAWRQVGAFGAWRGGQVGITPALLTAARSAVVATAGAAALGALEGARILVAPAVLVVQGFGSYLLTSYVRDHRLPLPALLSRATRASLGLGLTTLLAGGLAALAVPLVSPVITGGRFDIEPLAVLAWSLYSASVATLQPFASLAAARHRQRAVFSVRLADSALAAVLVAAVCFTGMPVTGVPVALAVGPAVGGLLVRRLVLAPMVPGDGGARVRAFGSSRRPLDRRTEGAGPVTRHQDSSVGGGV
jgi:O-antigen/teichoic acid export membrane protein